MSGQLPVVSGAEVVKALERAGFAQARTKGSHAIMRSPNGRGATVPLHRTVKRGTLAAILRQVGLTPDEFVSLL